MIVAALGTMFTVASLGNVASAAANLEAEIHKNAACGPHRPTLILVGYSEGANVIKETLNDIASSPEADIIGAAVNIGDPTRSNSQPPIAGMNTVNADWTPAPSPGTFSGGVLGHIPVPSPFAGDASECATCAAPDVGDPAPEVLTPFQSLAAPSKAPQSPGTSAPAPAQTPAQTPTAPAQQPPGLASIPGIAP